MDFRREPAWLQAGINGRIARTAGGIIRFYTATDAVLGQVTLNSPSHTDSSVTGLATLIITPAITAKATAAGTAAKATVFEADGVTALLSEGTVGTAGTPGAVVIVDKVDFAFGDDIIVTEFNVQA